MATRINGRNMTGQEHHERYGYLTAARRYQGKIADLRTMVLFQKEKISRLAAQLDMLKARISVLEMMPEDEKAKVRGRIVGKLRMTPQEPEPSGAIKRLF